jgi:hypothetical protein
VPTGVALEPFQKWLKEDSGGRADSAAAKLVVGANYVELPHACNPFEPCAECAQALAGTPWAQARAALIKR